MGASQFIVTGHGVDVGKAFDAAVSAAQHESGHGGYTGTIAEKSDYVIIAATGPLPISRKVADLEALRLLREDDDRISDKWGPAGAIRFTEDGKTGWIFFGWASE